MHKSKILSKTRNIKDLSLLYLKKLKITLLNTKLNDSTKLQKQISTAVLKASELNEPYLLNILKYCFNTKAKKDIKNLREAYLSHIQNAIKSIDLTESSIKDFAVKKVPKQGVIFVHGNDSLTVDIIKAAKKSKSFEIHTLSSNTYLISELKKSKIKFQCFADRAIRIAVKKADIVLLGCYAVTPEKIIHSVGSELAAELAHKRNIPVYVCTPALTFTQYYHIPKHKISRKGHMHFHNYDYEQIDPELVTGIISEIGIYDHRSFIDSLEQEMPWMFTSSFS